MDPLLEDLKTQIAQRKVVVIVGAGVSIAATRGSEAASWTELLRSGVARVGSVGSALPSRWQERQVEALDGGDMDESLGVAEQIARKLGAPRGGEYRRWLRESVGALRVQDREVIDALIGLGAPLCTTNYDGLLEECTGRRAVSWRDRARCLRVLRGDEADILHLHGHWEEPESVVLGIRSYEQVLQDEHAQALQQGLSMYQTLLFVGFGAGLRDPNFSAFLAWCGRIFPEAESRHYRLARARDVSLLQAEHTPGQRLFVLSYGQEYADLAAYLRQLAPDSGRLSDEAAGPGEAADGPSPRERALELAVAAYRTSIAGNTFFQRVRFADIARLAEAREQRGIERIPLFIQPVLELHDPARVMLPQQPARPVRLEGLEGLRWDAAVAGTSGEPLRSSVRTLSEVLADNTASLCVLIGGPGAGKTELSLWLMAKLCTPGESIPGLRPDVVPLRIELRLYDADRRDKGAGYDFFTYVAQTVSAYSEQLDVDQLKALGRQGRLLWIFDGMDEVRPVKQRQHYAEQIVDLLRNYPGRVLITSRRAGCEDLLEALGACPVYSLRDFDDAQIEAFLQNWYRLAFVDEPEKGELRRLRLENAIKQSSGLRELCRKPLLLTLLALLNRGDELPRRRHKLFERALELLVAQWETNKGLPPADARAAFECEDKLEYLRELAWAMQRNCWPDSRNNLIQRDSLQAFTARFCQRHFSQDEDRAQRRASALIDDLEERNGILVHLGGDRYSFVHRTFLEYLAAKAFVSFRTPEQQLADITQLAHDESWLEILTLACGLLDDTERTDQVLRAVQAVLRNLELSFGGRGRRAYAYAFCIRCLAEVRRLQQEPMRSLTHGLMRLLQQDARAVARRGWVWWIGDEIIEALRFFGPRWPEQEAWLRWALLPEWMPERSWDDTYSWTQKCVLASAEPGQRIDLLVALLGGGNGNGAYARATLEEAAMLGPWSLDEALSLARQLESADGDVHRELGDHFAEHANLGIVQTLLQAPLHDEIRFFLAAGVRRALNQSVVEQAGQAFFELTLSPYAVARNRACRFLLPYVNTHTKVRERFEQLLAGDPDPAVRILVAQALLDTDARERALAELLAMQDCADPGILRLLAHFLTVRNEERALSRTLWLRLLDAEPAFILGEALGTLVRQFWDEEVKAHVVRRLNGSHSNSPFRANYLAVPLFEIPDEETNLAALQAFVATSSSDRPAHLWGHYLQRYPDKKRWIADNLRAFLAAATDEHQRLQIAQCLRRAEQEEVANLELLRLAQGASKEEIKLAAAAELRRTDRLLDLAKSAESPELRTSAIQHLFFLEGNGNHPWYSLLLDIVESDSSERVRWVAADDLLESQLPPEMKEHVQRAVGNLATSATDEAVRCEAAVRLAHRPSLSQLSTSARDESVRQRASDVLSWLELRAEILHLAPGSARDRIFD